MSNFVATSHNLTTRYPIISDQIKKPALDVVLAQLERTLRDGVPGAVVEFGCYIGTTSLFVRRLLDMHEQAGGAAREFHVYDSFAGLPDKAPQDMTPVGADFKAGELAVSRKQFTAEFARAHLRPPMAHKAWFKDLTDREVPGEIAFAFLDGDFYDSIMDSLRLVWPRLQSGGSVCFDDYQRDALPGVTRAVRDYFQGTPPAISVSHNIGVLRKPEA